MTLEAERAFEEAPWWAAQVAHEHFLAPFAFDDVVRLELEVEVV